MTEAESMRQMMLEVTRLGHRVFRNNTGQGWVGKIIDDYVNQYGRCIVLQNPRPLHAGLCEGSSDLIGWTRIGEFLAIEAKSPRGKVTMEQKNFIDTINAADGVAFVARSIEDIRRELGR